jgi:hypothetical protein
MTRRKYTRTEACSSHCRMCGLHFASDAAFDAHLAGGRRKWGHYYPEDVKVLRIRTTDGVCNMSAERETGITLWEHWPNVDAVRERKASGKLAKKD